MLFREDGSQEVLAPNVLDLIENPIISCHPDGDDSCGLLFGRQQQHDRPPPPPLASSACWGSRKGLRAELMLWLAAGEKTTKIFALDSESGQVKWVNAKLHPSHEGRLHLVGEPPSLPPSRSEAACRGMAGWTAV